MVKDENDMDRGKRPGNFLGTWNSKLHLDLKGIIRENALPFLPAKSLVRFQCVCRDWKLQISTPFFAHNQSLSCHDVSGCIHQIPGGPPTFVSADPITCGVPDPLLRFLPEPVDIRSSSNGLLCCQGQAGDKPYYICNPVTQQWKKLPKPIADHGYQPAIVLIFEPSLLNFEADYKLVCAFPSADFGDAIEFEVYSSKEGSWKVSGEICFAAVHIDPRSGVYADGVVYWKGKSLLCFDVTKDRSQVRNSFMHGILGTIDGKLCVVSINSQTLTMNVLNNAYSNTMEMSSRTRMWKATEKVILDKGLLNGSSNQSILFARSNLLLIRSGGELFSYDWRIKELKAMGEASYHRTEMICLPYVNSFASL
ncbi:F-box protein At5g07610-like isoform X1 [Primulina tabacum]|uniref:F-box protein At5g07610-like isoform X1 n=2 Tax=Primulina tabacum TaxID=48773 RepID=UPI003F5A9939